MTLVILVPHGTKKQNWPVRVGEGLEVVMSRSKMVGRLSGNDYCIGIKGYQKRIFLAGNQVYEL